MAQDRRSTGDRGVQWMAARATIRRTGCRLSPAACSLLLPLTILLIALNAAPVRAGGARSGDTPLDQAKFEQRLNAQVAPDLTLRDDTGRIVRLGDYFGAKPTLLVPVYYTCPNLCSTVLADLTARLRELGFNVGNEFNLVIFSIDPRDTPAVAADKKQQYLALYGRPETAPGWHLLTGDQPTIQRLAAMIGMRYAFDARTNQYAHPSGVIVLTPQGRISKYFAGLSYSARDLRLGLVEASANKIGTLLDQVMLRCYRYDPASGTYTLAIMRLVRFAGATTVALIGAALALSYRRERRVAAPVADRGARIAR